MRTSLIGQAASKRRATIPFALFIARNVFGQDLVPSAIASPAPEPAGATAELERVIVTGSNIPTAEEVGPRSDRVVQLQLAFASRSSSAWLSQGWR
jgi:hypothetical protein